MNAINKASVFAHRIPPLMRLLRRRGHADRVAFYRQFIAPGDLVFDVGAHVGNRTAAFRELGARVVAVEPQPSCLAELRARWADDPDVVIVPMGVSDAPGEAQMQVASASTVSTLSDDWREVAEASSRFSGITWRPGPVVPLTTLGALVAEHGVPAFCKIDVEGFESRVLAGLDRPIGVVSIEWVPENMRNTEESLDRLDELGAREFNVAVGETNTLDLAEWVTLSGLREHLVQYTGSSVFGDLYARF